MLGVKYIWGGGTYFEEIRAIATPAKETMLGVKYFATSVYATVQ